MVIAADAVEIAPRLTFWGGATLVTGSMHLFEAGRYRILLDCGLYQGKREEARRRNGEFPFDPRSIDAVLLSHAHIDHCGNLPTLVRRGFTGPIFCTPATRDLIALMLADSAKIQEEDAAYLTHNREPGQPQVPALYDRRDVDSAVLQCRAVNYDETFEVLPGITSRFADAGHILGSATVHVRAAGKSLTYTGDLGRLELPLLKPPAPLPAADLLACESTYGGRQHSAIAESAKQLGVVARRTIERGGKVLVPAFSLGRTQLLLHYLRNGQRDGDIPRVPIYVDSPLAADVTEVFRRHTDCLDAETTRRLADDPDFLGGDTVYYVRSFEESQDISTRNGPCIIVAASGMCDAGRIQYHLKNNVDDPRSTVILVSYQAPNTVGRRLLEQKPTIKLFGREWNKWAEIVQLDGFSAHADRHDLEALLAPLAGKVGKIRLIHGEKDQSMQLAQRLNELGFPDVALPELGQPVVL